MEILKTKRTWLVIIIILVIEICWGIWYLNENEKSFPNQVKQKKPEVKKTVSLSLDPSEGKFFLTQEFHVAVVLSTGGKPAVGADVILEYDPNKLEILKITPGPIFDSHPKLKKENGQIFISAVSQQGKAFRGQRILAQLTVKGRKPAEAKLMFQFKPNKTTDSNVAIKNSHKDGLEEVKNGSYTLVNR